MPPDRNPSAPGKSSSPSTLKKRRISGESAKDVSVETLFGGEIHWQDVYGAEDDDLLPQTFSVPQDIPKYRLRPSHTSRWAVPGVGMLARSSNLPAVPTVQVLDPAVEMGRDIRNSSSQVFYDPLQPLVAADLSRQKVAEGVLNGINGERDTVGKRKSYGFGLEAPPSKLLKKSEMLGR